MSRYAENTSVPVERSKAEIESTLSRYGADSFMHGWENNRALIAFHAHGRRVRFVLPLPDRKDDKFWKTPSRGTRRSETQAYTAWEQECRQRWRALALAIKAKLEVVECGIATFEDEFLAHIVLPNTQTVGEYMHPQIEKAYKNGTMPRMLPMLTAGAE